MDLKGAVQVILTNLCEDEECFFSCDICQEAQKVLKDYVEAPETNFNLCSESVENMASVIDIIKVGWTKEQIIEWLNKPAT